MSITNLVKNLCTKLGNNSKPIYPILAISAANGIFRPTFTMLKKGENPESKRYAALREGITELVAMPTYFVSGIACEKLGAIIAEKGAVKEIAKREAKGEVLSDALKTELKQTKINHGKTGFMLIGVCVAAGIIIPALCSAVVTPIMSKINKNKDKKLDIKENAVTEAIPFKSNAYPVVSNYYSHPVFAKMSSGMKVGGL